jgi:hypothetical protein
MVLAGYLVLDDVVRRGNDGWAHLVGLALLTAALLYAHYWSLWFLGAVVIVLAWRSWRGDAPTVHRARRALLAMIIGGLAFLPWVPTMLYQSANTGTPWAQPQRPTSVIAVTLADFGGGGFRDAELIGTLLAMLFVLGLFGRGLSRNRIELELRTRPQFRYEAVVVAVTFALGSVAAYVTSSAYASRYAAVIFPVFALVVAGGVVRFVDRWVRFAVLASVLALFGLGAYFNTNASRTQSAEIAEGVAANARPGDLVVFCPDQLGPAGSRAMPGDLDLTVFPDFARPERLDWVGSTARNESADAGAFAEAAAERAAGRGIFLVWNGLYRGLEGQCEAVLDGLSAARGGGQVVVPDGGGSHFEHAQLVWFPAPP